MERCEVLSTNIILYCTHVYVRSGSRISRRGWQPTEGTNLICCKKKVEKKNKKYKKIICSAVGGGFTCGVPKFLNLFMHCVYHQWQIHEFT